MTDAELRDAAVAELKQTTRGLKNYTPTPTSHWYKALDYLGKIGAAAPPPPPPPPPSPPPPPTGTTVFQVDYTAGDALTKWDVIGIDGAGGSAAFVTLAGERQLRIAIPAFTNSHGRYEPTKLHANGSDFGMTSTYEMDFTIDPSTDWAPANSWNNLIQFKINSPDEVGVSLCVDPLDYAEPRFIMRMRGAQNYSGSGSMVEKRLDCGPVVTGQNINLRWVVKWHNDPAQGYMQIWRNGAEIVPKTMGSTTILSGGQPVQHKLSQELYCGPSSKGQVIYYKGIRVSQ